MPRYYFDDPLEAAWMAKHYGMKLQSFIEEENRWVDAGARFIDCNDTLGELWKHDFSYLGNIYIHPDSLPLLQPQVGDDVEFNSIKARYCGMTGHNTHIVTTRTPNYPEPPRVASYELAPNTRFIIEKRNGIPFFWPKTESDGAKL